jgi:hypothetical protein
MAPTIMLMRSSPNGMATPFSADTDGQAADGQAAESAADEVQERHCSEDQQCRVVLRVPSPAGNGILNRVSSRYGAVIT